MTWSRCGWLGTALAVAVTLAPTVAAAQSARDLLTQAAFEDRDKSVALKRIDMVQRLAARSDDKEARIVQATALGYRAKLTGNRSDAIAARKQFEAIVTSDPRDAEAQLALGAWHIGAIFTLGRFVGRAVVGAQKGVGLGALDQAVALNTRPMFCGLAALLRLELDPTDPKGRALAEMASRAPATTPLDHILQRSAAAVLIPLRAGNRDETRALAARLLPFGRIGAP